MGNVIIQSINSIKQNLGEYFKEYFVLYKEYVVLYKEYVHTN